MIAEGGNSERVRLEWVERQFAKWRRGRRRVEAIPEGLWAAAVKLTELHSVNHVSRALRLNHTKLKERAAGACAQVAGTVPGFVEVDLPGLGQGQCLLEFEDGRGGKVKICWQGAAGGEVAEVVRALWSQAR